MMAHRARAVALLAVLLNVIVMGGAAHEQELPPIGPEGYATAHTDGFVAAEGELVDRFDLPADVVNAAAAPISASLDLPPPLLVNRPVHRFNFYAAIEAVSLARELDDEQVFATLNSPTEDVLNASDLSFQQEPGMRFTLGAKLTECFAMEMTAMGLADWKDAREVSDSSSNPAGTMGNLFSPFTGFGSPPEVGLDFNDFASLRLISSLDTFEWNLRQRLGATDSGSFSATAIYGFRYLSVDELLVYRTESTLPLPAGTFNTLDVALENHLYGLQLGGTLDFLVASWRLNLEGRAALCRNLILEEANFTGLGGGNPPSEPADRIREDGSTAFMGHLSATVEIRLAKHWVGRVGYQALYVDSLALASRSAVGPLLHDASALYHGPIVGLLIAW